MTAKTSTLSLRRLAALAGVAACVLAPAAFAQGSGDRQLLRTNTGDPYLMVLFDNSASMNWASTCDADDIAAGSCDFLCETENCPVPKGGDDSNSKIYQAKEALYNAMLDVDGAEDIYYGFATLNQDNLAVGAKHWLYDVKSMANNLVGSFPAALTALFAVGTEEVFGAVAGLNPGFDFGCDRYEPATDNSGGGFDSNLEVGCWPNTTDAVPLSGSGVDAWKTAKLHRLPKGGVAGATPVSYYVSNLVGAVTTIYRVTFQNGTDYDSTTQFDATVKIGICVASVCVDDAGALTVTYERSGDTSFFFWEGVLTKNRTATDLTKVAYLGGYPDSDAPSYDTLGNATGTDGVYWASDIYAQETCRGWDPSGTSYPSNSDGTEPFSTLDTDPFDAVNFAGYNLRFLDDGYTYDLTGTDWEAYQYLMLRGDVIPLDWNDRNFDRVLTRLNPQHDPLSPGGNATSFKQAVYFADDYPAGEGFLRLKDENVRPILGHGLTPLAGWYSFFRSWYSGCGKPGNCDGIGWSDVAAAFDPDFACRKKYVLMLTDGGETCDGSPQLDAQDYYDDNEALFPPGFEKGQNADQCRYRASMSAQEEVESLVIGFGVENKEKLQCANTPVVFVENKEELFDEIKKFLARIQEEAAAFASAAVPTVQANIADKVYLSSFIPLNEEAIWPGRLDAYLKPLPLDPDTGLPDRNKPCAVFDATVNQSECFAWDAGDSQLTWNIDGGTWDPQGLLAQAPFPEALDGVTISSLQLGAGTTGADQRRVFFGLPDADPTSIVSKMQWFQYPVDGTVDNTEQVNFEFAWNLPVPALYDPADAQYVTNRDTISGIIDFTLAQKRAEIDNPADADNPFHIQYLLGDIFHSNPLVLNPPADFEFFTKDLYWGRALCGESAETTANRGAEKLSYTYFSNANLCRRVMIFAGADDGQLHAFDAGMFQGTDCQLPLPANAPGRDDLADLDGTSGAYDYGTGRELFSFIPQAMMPVIKELSEIEELTTEYGVDGTMRVADVFLDPIPAADGSITCSEREWRTVLLGHYREGGPGVFALDITQPDILDESLIPQPAEGSRRTSGDNYVPSCTPAYGDAHDPECGALPFPALRWEFRDLNAIGAPADDDLNDETDLAEGWSRPLAVRMQFCDGECDEADGEPEDRYVAIFGGGVSESPENSSLDVVGDWLYMVDIETGELLYKRGGFDIGRDRQIITGSVATDVTGVDADVDGVVDTLYFGTTAGYVYKVSLGDGPFELGDHDSDPTTAPRIVDPVDDDDVTLTGFYDPFVVFSTQDRAIYLEINAVYVPKMGSYSILFGTGNRWNLWDFETAQEGRFYALLDQDWSDSDRDGVLDEIGGSPLTEANYTLVDPDDLVTPIANYLFGEVADGLLPGWYFPLELDEKLITEAFTLSGVSFFTVFHPLQVELQGQNSGVCAFSGESKIFVVNTVTTKGYAVQEGTTDRTRYVIAPTFTTQPFVEQSLTQNAPTTSQNNADTWTDALAEVNADLKKLFPPGARFASYTLDIKTIRSDTGIVFVAPVPVAIEPHNWKEF